MGKWVEKYSLKKIYLSKAHYNGMHYHLLHIKIVMKKKENVIFILTARRVRNYKQNGCEMRFLPRKIEQHIIGIYVFFICEQNQLIKPRTYRIRKTDAFYCT